MDRNNALDKTGANTKQSPSSRRAWIEIQIETYRTALTKSPSSRRAWIEISVCQRCAGLSAVALLTEGVDRNNALDKTGANTKQSPSSRRAWIEIQIETYRTALTKSPSSRRAWIEISVCQRCAGLSAVALLTEGVDRNIGVTDIAPVSPVALLTEGVDRNQKCTQAGRDLTVALLTEGVDRNVPSR